MSALMVVSPGVASTIQDLGRPGYGRYGVSGAGAMDRLAMRIANRLVGNDEGEAVVEFAMLGGTYEAVDGSCRIAVAGGDFDIKVDGVSQQPFRSVDVPPGVRLAIRGARSGIYGYLAIAGGFEGSRMLGSRSVHARSGIGGGVLRPGAPLRLRRPAPPAGPTLSLDPSSWPSFDGPIRVIWGPQDDCFTEAGRAAFLSADYRIAARSDRMGYRLEGPPIEHAGGFNIVSDGIVLGSIQVPGTGQPIVLMADRQSTGGYPKIATVISADIRRLVQRGPDRPVRFAVVSPEEADAILDAERTALLDLYAKIRPVETTDLFRSDRLLGLNLVDGFVLGVP